MERLRSDDGHSLDVRSLKYRDRYNRPAMIPDTSPRFAVFGHPVAHSLSPAIQRAFAAQFDSDIHYTTIDATPQDFAPRVLEFFGNGGKGANVTVPHKRAAAELADLCSDAVQRAGVANVLTRLPDGRLRADNTDGSGLLRDLVERRDFNLRGRRVLLLGAGGAAQGIAFPLIDAAPAELVITNRTPQRAQTLADRLGPAAHAQPWQDLEKLGAFDLILNATSAGVLSQPLVLPPSLVRHDTLCYDLAYGPAAHPFFDWAQIAGTTHAIDGLGMLIETAADSYALWHGHRPDTQPVFAALNI